MQHTCRRGEAFTGFWLRPKGKRPLGRPRSRREDNIKMDVRETGINRGTGFGWLRIESDGELL
jgi:hypothetical protein